jgi:TRAP-type C4-dicarboxylate transport system permease small subunit
MLLLRRLTGMMAAICTNVEVIFLAVMTFLVFSQVVSRYLFSYSFAWVEALARYLMIWMAFFGAASLFKDDAHIRMDLVYNKFPQKVRSCLGLLFELFEIAFLVMLFKLGLQYAESVSIVIDPTLRLSMRWPAMIISISSVLMIFFILSHMIQTVISLTGRTLTDD